MRSTFSCIPSRRRMGRYITACGVRRRGLPTSGQHSRPKGPAQACEEALAHTARNMRSDVDKVDEISLEALIAALMLAPTARATGGGNALPIWR